MAISVKERENTSENKVEDNKDNSALSSKTKKCDRCKYASKWASHLKKHKAGVHDKVYEFACDQCELRGTERNKIELHKLTVHGDVFNFPCNQCNLKFKVKRPLAVHIKVAHERHKLHKCEKCDYAAPFAAQVRDHVKVVHDKLKHYCDVVGCDFGTVRKQSLQTHFQKSHLKLDLRKHKCDHCNYSVDRKKNLQEHVDFRHDKKVKYVCGPCKVPYENKNKLEHHKKIVHEGVKEEFNCDVVGCDYKAAQKATLKCHFRRIHLKKHRCEKCDYAAKGQKQLQEHVDLKHDKKFKYVCDVCEVPYVNEKTLDSHKKIVHLGIKEFECDVVDCDYKTAHKRSLKGHFQRIHLKLKVGKKATLKRHFRRIHLKKHRCEKCDYAATGKTQLQEHLDFKHDKKFKYVCDVCKVPYVNEKTLDSHKKIVHLGIKEFECDVVDCDYKAGHKKALVNHFRRIHLKIKIERKHKCNYCDYAAKGQKQLQDHVDFKHKKRFKYVCEVCNVPYPNQHQLKLHDDAVHQKLRRYECKECLYGTNRKNYLESHVKVVHRKIVDDFKCLLCPFVTGYRKTLKRHEQSHVRRSKGMVPTVEKKLALEKFEIKKKESKKVNCEKFAFSTQNNLTNHKQNVQERLTKYKCKECPYATDRNERLEDHVKVVHRKIVDDLKCILCLHVTGYRELFKAHANFHIKGSKRTTLPKKKNLFCKSMR